MKSKAFYQKSVKTPHDAAPSEEERGDFILFFSDADERTTTIHVMFSDSRRGFAVNNALELWKVIRRKAVK